jgi:hypothetical protein
LRENDTRPSDEVVVARRGHDRAQQRACAIRPPLPLYLAEEFQAHVLFDLRRQQPVPPGVPPKRRLALGAHTVRRRSERAIVGMELASAAPGIAAVVLGFGFVALIAVFALERAPEWLATEGLTGKDKAGEIASARTAVLTVLAGVIAVVGAMLTGLSYRLNRAGQITERFTRAIEQLGSAELDVRLGGIYALERIARDSRDDHPQILEVLTAYVREHARRRPDGSQVTTPGTTAARTPDQRIEAIRALERIAKGSEDETEDHTAPTSAGLPATDDQPEPVVMPTDVQAAMTVLGRRDASKDRAEARLDLVLADLRGANLFGANLKRANLSATNLSTQPGRRIVNLSEANLQHASLYGANVQGVYLSGANLQGANLTGSNLQNALLYRANLQGADLSGANLHDVSYNAATKWPEGFNPSDHGARLRDEAYP